MRVHILAVVAIFLSLHATTGAAQTDDRPSGLGYRERAMALRPTGMLMHRVGWHAVDLHLPDTSSMAHSLSQDVEARIPIDSLVIEASAGLHVSWGLGPFNGAIVHNPQLGAHFRDAPARGWRYELGGMVTIATLAQTPSETRPPGSLAPLFPRLPIRHALHRMVRTWSAYRYVPGVFAVVPHARLEVDALAELVLGLDVDLPILIAATGSASVHTQVALEIAGRFERTCLAGLRTELTTYPNVNVLFEPFVRLAVPFLSTDLFTRISLRIPVGPTFPFLTDGPAGHLGGAVELGALF